MILRTVAAGQIILSTTLFSAPSPEASGELDAIVVTASGNDQALKDVPQTIRSYSEEEINLSAPRQLADFFRENSLGELQDFGPGHSTIVFRGATTALGGQGWNDYSEIALLVNGRSSGTANLGKLSLHDIGSIEILRGPSSVLYGSSALGGVVNLITKDGTTFQGTELTTLYSTFDRYTGVVETGGKRGAFDYYLELSATTAEDYRTGQGSSGTQPNTSYEQRGANLTLGYDISDLHRLRLMVRQDGIYDAGHPGATYSLTDRDDRYGTSVELLYTGSTRDSSISWENRTFYVRDVDAFHWSQDPLIGLIPAVVAPVLIGTPGITRDDNERKLEEWGNRLSAEFTLTDSNRLILGTDLKYSETDNHRERTAAPGYAGGFIGMPVILPPLAVDSRTFTAGVFFKDTQKFLDEKLLLEIGGRYDRIDQTALPTQNSTITGSDRDNDVFVWQGGAVYHAAPWISFRGNLGTGFLSANPTQLFGNVRQVNGFTTLANADLKDEKSFGWDLGTRITGGGLTLDLTFFETTIEDYIIGELVPGTPNLRWTNADERIVRGLELQASYDLASATGLRDHFLEPYVSGSYYFKKQATDLSGDIADQALLSDYHLNIGLRTGRKGSWDANLYANISGPSAVNAGYLQNANVGLANIQENYSLPSFAILNFSASYQITPQAKVFLGVNNILDKNYSTYFYALNNNRTSDVAPYLLPGTVSGEGMSSPGREFFTGVSLTF